MSQPRVETRVGLFVFGGLILVAALMINFSKGLSFFHPTYELIMRTSNVGGMKSEAAVQMSGVQIGNVAGAMLTPDNKQVLVRLRILKQYQIRSDSRFFIEQAGFLGDQFVAISAGSVTAPVLTNGQEVTCDIPFDLQETARAASSLIHRIDETVQKLNDAITRIDKVVLNDQTLTNISLSVENLRNATEAAMTTVHDVNLLVKTNAEPIAGVVANLRQTSSNLVAFSTNLNHVALSVDDTIATNRARLTLAMDHIESATRNLETGSSQVTNLLNDLELGKGTAGALLKDETMRANLGQIFTNMSGLSENLSVTSSNLNHHGLWWLLWEHKPAVKVSPAPAARPLKFTK